jgi:glucose/arabinose dehydrogenase
MRTPLATATQTPMPPATPRLPSVPPAADIRLPEGFTAFVVRDGLVNPAVIALGPSGSLYIAQSVGSIVRLDDMDGDGRYERALEVAAGLSTPNGLAFSPQGELFVSSEGRVSILRDTNGDSIIDETTDVISGLPHGRHQNNGLTFGPDGQLYVTNGSTCNDCAEEDDRSAVILRANPDGSGLHVFASGLRNTYDLVFDDRGRLWAADNGSDPPCNTIDELNLIEAGGDYGWPYGPACDSLASGIPPVASLGFNTASTGIDMYKGQHFPAPYRGRLFITLFGSFELAPVPGGRKLVAVRLVEGLGRPLGIVEDFATGFVRPVDVAMDRDGTLLVADWESGRLYRIVHTGP